MTATQERHEFQAEVTKLLDLLIHSLYSNKDIFLRELISNASDALDKLKFRGLTNSDILPSQELHIQIDRDKKARTLTISDNGIGMTHDELVENLGTIARSGTLEFVRSLQEAKDQQSAIDLIGQFGVGFYASFMVAERVEVITRAASSDKAFKWESAGDGAYTIEEAERAEAGTSITLHLRPEDTEDGIRDYTLQWVIKDIVKHHSDFVAFPIKMRPDQADDDDKIPEYETINSMKAIWTKSKNDITDEEANEFYKHITHDWTDPRSHIAVHMEGAIEARALLYIPSKAPVDLFHQEMSYRGLQLYIRRVFIMDECKDLMPQHLRFVKGVVDSDDLSLNVSREILQQDRKILAIRRYLVRKVLDELNGMRNSDRAKYKEFWTEFGPVLKEGFLGIEEKKETLFELVLSHSTRDEQELTTLGEYVGRMSADQEAIYYLTAPTLEAARQSPHLEAFIDKGYEVLLFTDRVDEVWLPTAPEFLDKKWQSVGKGEITFGDEKEKKEAEKELKKQSKDFKDLTSLFQELLEKDVKEVRLTNRLTSSPACLVGEEDDLSPQVAAMLRQMGQEVPEVKRILELNPEHPIVKNLFQRFAENKSDQTVRDYAHLLYGQALLAEGGQPNDPAAFSKQLAQVLEKNLSK